MVEKPRVRSYVLALAVHKLRYREYSFKDFRSRLRYFGRRSSLNIKSLNRITYVLQTLSRDNARDGVEEMRNSQIPGVQEKQPSEIYLSLILDH